MFKNNKFCGFGNQPETYFSVSNEISDSKVLMVNFLEAFLKNKLNK